MAFDVPLLADVQCSESQFPGLEGSFPGGGEIAAIERSLGRV